MQIRAGYEISYDCPQPTPMILTLSAAAEVRQPSGVHQPPLPFKCAGAPQKIVYLTADHLHRRGVLKDCSLDYYVHAPVIFGVPFFARELVKIAARYGIKVHYQHNLVAVDGPGGRRRRSRR
jgi:hypothetical protein